MANTLHACDAARGVPVNPKPDYTVQATANTTAKTTSTRPVAPSAPFEDNVNAALVQTLARSLNTSLTVLITVGAMLLLGGVTIREFLLVILIGVISGTYSSIGIASQVLVSWEQGDFGRWFGFLHSREADIAEPPSA